MGRDISTLLQDTGIGLAQITLSTAAIYAVTEYGPNFYDFMTKPFVPDPMHYLLSRVVGGGVPVAAGTLFTLFGAASVYRIVKGQDANLGS